DSQDERLNTPPALGERRHRRLARLRVAVRRGAVLMMPKGRPHPGRPYRGRMYLQDTADDSAISDDVEIVVIPLAGGAARCSGPPSACPRGLPFALLRFAANGEWVARRRRA